METVKTIEELKEGDVLTFGGKQHAFNRVTADGAFDFGDKDGCLFREAEVGDLIRWGAITREEPKEITERCGVTGISPLLHGQRVVIVPDAFANETQLEVTFKKVEP